MLSKLKLLNNNQLKIIAMISMLIDHAGKILDFGYPWCTAIGRIAFPIFAYMIAEGCHYTKNRKKYLLTIVSLAFIFQVVYFISSGSLYMNILFTFSLSILTIYCIDYFKNTKKLGSFFVLILELAAVVFLSVFLPKILPGTDFKIDYGILGILLPVAIYLMPNKTLKLICATIILSIMAILSYKLRWFALASIPLLAIYNENRGNLNLKYMFYVFYPLHLIVLYTISMLI